jgi:hypothetical protein
VSHSEDESGDVIMRDVEETHAWRGEGPALSAEPPLGLDGHTSVTLSKCLPKVLHVDNDEWVDQLVVTGCNAWYTSDGDIVLGEGNLPYGWQPRA